MNGSKCFLLDSNVFIEAAKRYYAFDIVPAFWEKLKNQAQAGRIASIDRVRKELERGKDQLAQWATHDFHEYFHSTNDAKVVRAYGDIMKWSHDETQYSNGAKAELVQALHSPLPRGVHVADVDATVACSDLQQELSGSWLNSAKALITSITKTNSITKYGFFIASLCTSFRDSASLFFCPLFCPLFNVCMCFMMHLVVVFVLDKWWAVLDLNQ